MIEVEGISKRYGDLYAIRDLSFSVEKGDVVGFLGPNGAGKTTTMRILTCFFPPAEGKARVAGYDVFDDSLEVRRRIGYLPENPPLYSDMTVRGYLRFAAKIRDVPSRQVTKRVSEVMGRCGLEKMDERLIGHLSKGYRQRVGLAQALVHDPPVLILDEPTRGLDPAQIIEVRELMRSLSQEHTIILSTHILPEVSQVCKSVAILSNGRIVASGTPENLQAGVEAVCHLDLQISGSMSGAAELLSKVSGVLSVRTDPAPEGAVAALTLDYLPEEDPRQEVARALVNAGFGLLEMSTRGVSLEDVYLRLLKSSAGREWAGGEPPIEESLQSGSTGEEAVSGGEELPEADEAVSGPVAREAEVKA